MGTCFHDFFAVQIAGQRVFVCVRCHENINTGQIINQDTWNAAIKPQIDQRCFEIYLKNGQLAPGRGFCIRCKKPTPRWTLCEQCHAEVGE